MPKATKVGKFRSAAKATSRDVRSAPLIKKKDTPKEDDGDANTSNIEGKETATLSRGQRKRLAKREQYLKREKMVMSSLRLQRLEEQKGKLDGLDLIREALGEATSSLSESPPPRSKISTTTQNQTSKKAQMMCNTNKSKKTLAATEISHMGLVLQHPSFKSNPFSAIQQHLRNSLSSDREKLAVESKKRSEEETALTAKKKEVRKERIRNAKFAKHKKGRQNNTNQRR